MNTAQTEINMPPKAAAKSKVQIGSTLPDTFVGARRLLRHSPWMNTMAFGFISSLVLIMPAFSIWFMFIFGKNVDFYGELSKVAGYFESFRWSIMAASYSFFYHMILTSLTLAPSATKYSSNPFIKSTGQVFGSLRFPLSFFISSLVNLAIYLNSGINTPVDEDIYLAAINSSKKAGDDKKSPYIMNTMDAYLDSIVKIIMSYRKFFKYIPYVLVLITTCILIEKIIMLYISHSFHKNFYTKRIQQNNLVLSCFETLSRRFVPAGLRGIKSGAVLKNEQSAVYAESIFNGLLGDSENRESLLLENFSKVLERSLAKELFDFFDFNKSGDISLSELKESIAEAYDERRNLLKAIKSNEKVINSIDNFFLTCIFLFKLSFLMPKINLSLISFLAYIGGSAVLLKFAFDYILEQIFGSAMHFLVSHPYDIGDKIQMEDTNYRIKDMGFWKTTLITPGGRISYVPNHTLFKIKFGNFRRSDRMESDIEMSMSLKTSAEDIQMYTSAFDEFIKDNGRYLDESIVIKEIRIINEKCMVIIFGVTHKFNFNNDDNLHFRCELIFKNMVRIAKEQNLEFYSLRYLE